MVAHRTAEAADSGLASTFDQTLERLDASIASIDAMGMTVVETLVSSRAQTEERIGEHVDDRLAALAKMIRSDNRVLAERMSSAEVPASATDAETLKQTLRAVKELQAGLGAEMVGSVERRFQTMSEQLHKETQSTAEATFAGGGVGADLPVLALPTEGISVIDALVGIGFAASRGEAKRLIAGGGARLDGTAITDDSAHIAGGSEQRLSAGKKKHGIIRPG